MCGIVGVLNFSNEPVAPLVVQAMADSIKHRGPDDQGIYCDHNVGLGHRRLSIIDLSSSGRQPMMTTDGRFVLTYNGEVYNFKEIRAVLQGHGYEFVSGTDSEVVLKAFQEWGESCVERFNGMFAFAAWDSQRRELTMARDRYGIKPLYYYRTAEFLVFGSEIKALLCHPKVEATVDKGGLLEYFSFQNFFTERTLFQGVKILSPGTVISFSADRPEATPREYWDFSFTADSAQQTAGEYREQLDYLIQQAVGRQLVSDVPLGSYLSGGMDSGTLAALAAKQLPYLNTFTVGFDLNSVSGMELVFDEREAAEHMSYLFQTEHYEMVLKAGDMERCMSDLVWSLEEPRVGQSYPNYYAAKLASRFVKVVLSGVGGDELFAGYPWRYYRAARNGGFEEYLNKYYEFWQRLIPDELMSSMFRSIWEEVGDVSPKDIMRSVIEGSKRTPHRPEDFVNESLYFEAKTFLHGLLVVEDKLSMAHSLETRVPFLDNELVNFAMKVPVAMKLRNLEKAVNADENDIARYCEDSKDGKRILREVMANYIPSEITEKRKQGFSAPDATWFRGDSIDYVGDLLLGHDAFIYQYLDKDTTHRLVQEHLSGKVNRRLLIWSLLNFEVWGQTFIRGRSSSDRLGIS